MKASGRYRPYEFIIDVEYIPLPSEEAREKAYDTHVKLFLKAKMRQLMQERQGVLDAEKNKGAGIYSKIEYSS
jgi:hypothetical protein